MATDKTGDVQGSSSSGKSGGGKNISALLKKLKGKINKNSDQKNLQTGANKGDVAVPATTASAFPGPTSNPDMPFVGVVAQDYLVKDQLKGFGFGQVVTDFGPSGTGFGGGATGVQPFAFGGTTTPPMAPFGQQGTPPAGGSFDLTAIPALTLPGTTTEGEGED